MKRNCRLRLKQKLKLARLMNRCYKFVLFVNLLNLVLVGLGELWSACFDVPFAFVQAEQVAKTEAEAAGRLAAQREAELEARLAEARQTMQLEVMEKECSAQAARIQTLQSLFDDVDAHLVTEKGRSAALRGEIAEQVRL